MGSFIPSVHVAGGMNPQQMANWQAEQYQRNADSLSNQMQTQYDDGATGRAFKDMADAQSAALDEQKADAERRKKEQADLEARDSARARQKSRALGARGRRDTILTSPLGVVGDAPAANKTLLGM